MTQTFSARLWSRRRRAPNDAHAAHDLDATRTSQQPDFYRSALVDLADNQGNTAEGVHIASAGGTWQILVCGFGGFRVRHQQMTFNPWLPDDWQEIRFRLRWRGNSVQVAVGHTEATFTLDAPDGVTEQIVVGAEKVTLVSNTPVTVQLSEVGPTSQALAQASVTGK